MQEKQEIILVRVLGLLTLVTGLYVIRPVWQPHVDMWFHLRSHASSWLHLPEIFRMCGARIAILCIAFQAILIAKFVVAYSLLRLRPRARFVAIAVLTADFVWRASGALTMFMIAAFVPPTPPPPMAEGGVTMTYSILPSYVIAIISIASVLVLIQEPIKALFEKTEDASGGLA